MTTQSPAAAVRAPAKPELKFGQMNILQKGVFVLKVTTMFVTFGFAFPNILSDE